MLRKLVGWEQLAFSIGRGPSFRLEIHKQCAADHDAMHIPTDVHVYKLKKQIWTCLSNGTALLFPTVR
jgi:hypothetical protein